MANENRGEKLEEFFRAQEKQIKSNDFYSRFMFLPVIVIVVSLLILLYNFTLRRLPITGAEAPKNILPRAENDKAYVVLVDKMDEEKPVEPSKSTERGNRINLNTASAKELDGLPGIGLVKAGEIVRLREEMGGFRTVEDVLNVGGIGEKIFENIKTKVFVD